MKHIAILGSTGSIGKNTLKVVDTHCEEFKVVALAANSDVNTLEHQIRKYRPRLAALNDQSAAVHLRERLHDVKCTEILSGTEGIQGVATIPEI